MSYAPRRWWRTATLMFGAFLLAAASLSAQFAPYDYPCWGDCFMPWGPANTATLTLPNGCIVRVVYTTRNACAQHDVAIIAIEPVTWQCLMLSNAALLNQTTEVLLQQNPMGFPPHGPNTCDTLRRVVAGCWGYKHNPCAWRDSLLVPCDTSSCCITQYLACVDSNWVRTVRRIYHGGGKGDSCNAQIEGTRHCTSICEDTTGCILPPDTSRAGRRESDVSRVSEESRGEGDSHTHNAPLRSSLPVDATRQAESALVPARATSEPR